MAGNGADFALVVNSEANTRVVDYSDRSSAVLWGDGASAAVVSGRVRSRVRVGQTGIGGDARGARTVTIPRFGHFAQQGSLVQRFAIKTMRASLNRSLAGFRARTPEPTGRTRFVGHQANGVALEHVYKSAGLAEDEHWQNVGHFGNTGASGAPCVLSQHWDDLGAGDFIPMVVVGSGLAWAWLELEVQ
jgi:3-oxoacyl-[acyl-carrier-protein] synthase-3